MKKSHFLFFLFFNSAENVCSLRLLTGWFLLLSEMKTAPKFLEILRSHWTRSSGMRADTVGDSVIVNLTQPDTRLLNNRTQSYASQMSPSKLLRAPLRTE